MYIADLHIHSRYSRATSKDCTPVQLDLWARRKGIQLLGTGDFTHPAWRQELKEALRAEGNGLYTLREELKCRDSITTDKMEPRFVVSGEISSIYKKNGKTRKVHNLILLPGLQEAERLSARLEAIGNIHSDGRPILGLDSRDLLEITLETCPDAIFIPAHIWTPHFSMFGAFSGFNTVEECFEDLAGEIHALETGLSSDPAMNRRLSQLDGYHLISNSDAHSPAKLGREANLLETELSYEGLYAAVQKGEGLAGTIEFFPEEGKYHLDGHRKCQLCLEPSETRAYGGRCPVCGKKLTVGVLHRVEELADWPQGYAKEGAKPFESLVPLPEVIAASTDKSAASVKVQRQYEAMLKELGTEFSILREVPEEALRSCAGPCIAEGIKRLREGRVQRIPGFDGEYGKIKIIDKEEIPQLCGQLSLFESIALPAGNKKKSKAKKLSAAKPGKEKEEHRGAAEDEDNGQQEQAITASSLQTAVIAGPGTGKTYTLTRRICFLLDERGIAPEQIAAVTFTNKAAEEMGSRLEASVGKEKSSRIKIGTFHSLCLALLREQGAEVQLADEREQEELAEKILKQEGLSGTARRLLREVSARKNGETIEDPALQKAADLYEQQLKEMGLLDFDDLILEVLKQQEISPCGEEGILLVDEFQDINRMQYRLIRQWAGSGLFVIGDPDQAIYGFRGADPQCFQKLEEDFPHLEKIELNINYRSAPEILDCALRVMAAGKREKRSLKARKRAGGTVRIIQTESPLAEGICIAKEINKMTGGMDMTDAQEAAAKREKHRSFSDIAVLYRTHHQAKMLEKCLKRESIPFTVTGKEPFLQDSKVCATMDFFRSLLRGETEALLAAGRRLFDHKPEESIELLADRFLPLLEKEKPQKLLQEWSRQAGLADSEPMKKLIDTAYFYEDVRSFFDSIMLGEEQDFKRNAAGESYRSGAVSLMTLHGAKGLEFPVVFLCGIKDGIIPMKQADEEEERRLFFVGMTRAQEELLFLTGKPDSPFLSHMPKELHPEGAARKPKEDKQLSLFEL